MKNIVACLLGLVVAQGKQDEFGAAVHPEDEQFKSFSISVPTPSETLQVAISKLSSHSFTMSKATAAAGLPDMTLQKLKKVIAEMPQVSRTITGEFLVDPSGAAIGVSIQHGKVKNGQLRQQHLFWIATQTHARGLSLCMQTVLAANPAWWSTVAFSISALW